MEYLLDNPAVERTFQEIISRLKPLQNGETAASLSGRGVNYKRAIGTSVVVLRQLAGNYEKNHLLALKLWNKQWRETMILATLLEESSVISADQSDYWVKSFDTIEMAEQAAMNLLAETPFAFEKACQWALGRKFLVKVTGLLVMGRLALVNKEASNEQFETFFEVLPPLSKDTQLRTVFYRVFTQLGMRNSAMNQLAIRHAHTLLTLESDVSKGLAEELLKELQSEDVQDIVRMRD